MPQNTTPQTAIIFDAKYMIKTQFAIVEKSLFFSTLKLQKLILQSFMFLRQFQNCLWNII